jgi:hypothetical protein
MTADIEEMGPIDYVVVEFPGSRMTGEGLPLLVDLVDRGIIRILDSCASLRLLLASQTTTRPPRHSRCSGARAHHPIGMIKGPAVATTSGTAARTNRGHPRWTSPESDAAAGRRRPLTSPTRLGACPLRGSGAAASSGALRAIDPTTYPRSWRTLGPRRRRRRSRA